MYYGVGMYGVEVHHGDGDGQKKVPRGRDGSAGAPFDRSSHPRELVNVTS